MKDKGVYLFFIFIILCILYKARKQNFTNTQIKDVLEKIYNNKTKFENHDTLKQMPGIDCIYCITMPSRKNYMRNILDNFGYNYILFDAITPGKLTSSDYTILVSDKQFINKKTRLPCQLSFTMCYKHAVKNKYKTIIVFEDDIIINTNNAKILKGIDQFNNSDYNVFYMGYCELNCKQNFKKNNELVNVPDYSKLYCAHSICYKVKYLPSIIENLYPMNNEFDIKLLEIYKKLNYKVCIPDKVYFDQNKDLGTNNETLNPDGTLLLSPPTCIF